MTHYPQMHPTLRAPRVQLQTAPALVKLNDGQKANGKLQIVSITGGLLQLARALSEGDFVEVAFQTQSGKVQGMAEMLNPLRSVPGSVFQPFRFVALGDEDHQILKMIVESVADRSFLGLRSSQFSARRT
jgi:hypothetical protein